MAAKTLDEVRAQLSAEERTLLDNVIAKHSDLKDGWLRQDDYSRHMNALKDQEKEYKEALEYNQRMKVWADEKGPAHIEAVPHRDNCNRGTGASARNLVKTHCPQGHLYDEANTYHYPDGSGRKCRACHREEQARYKAAKRLA